MFQCVAVCCSVLQCVAVCCSVVVVTHGDRGGTTTPCMQILLKDCSVAVCCHVWQCVAVCCSVLQFVAVCCSVFQCVVLQCKGCDSRRSRGYNDTMYANPTGRLQCVCVCVCERERERV